MTSDNRCQWIAEPAWLSLTGSSVGFFWWRAADELKVTETQWVKAFCSEPRHIISLSLLPGTELWRQESRQDRQDDGHFSTSHKMMNTRSTNTLMLFGFVTLLCGLKCGTFLSYLMSEWSVRLTVTVLLCYYLWWQIRCVKTVLWLSHRRRSLQESRLLSTVWTCLEMLGDHVELQLQIQRSQSVRTVKEGPERFNVTASILLCRPSVPLGNRDVASGQTWSRRCPPSVCSFSLGADYCRVKKTPRAPHKWQET